MARYAGPEPGHVRSIARGEWSMKDPAPELSGGEVATVERHRMGHDIVALLPRLRRFAAGLSGSMQEGDDIVQAACLRALERHRQYREGSRLDSWLFTI